MSLPSPKFEDQIWDGTTPQSRPNTDIYKSADGEIAGRHSSEIIALETTLYDALAVLDVIVNPGLANSVLGVKSDTTGLEYKELIAGDGIVITHGSESITFTPSIVNLSTETVIESGDFVPFWDLTATAANKKIDFSDFESRLNHDNLLGFETNEHIDHNFVSISAGEGLTGGGNISITRKIDLDIGSLATATIVSDDELLFWDVTPTAAHKKSTFTNFVSAISHDLTGNYVANEHIDWTNATENFKTTGTLQTQNFLFGESGGDPYRLGIVNQTSGTGTTLDFYAYDGDGTDDVALNIFGIGTSTDWTPYETLIMQWNSSESEFQIHSHSAGAGSVYRPINLYVTPNPGQLYLATSGAVGIGETDPQADFQIGGRFTLGNRLSGAIQAYFGYNIYWDGSNYRYVDSNAGVIFVLDDGGNFNVYCASSGTAGDVATLPQRWRVLNTGEACIGSNTSPTSRLEVYTELTEGKEAIGIIQNDSDQPFINYQGTAAASAAFNISTWTAGNSIQGFIQIEINGTMRWLAYYDDPTS